MARAEGKDLYYCISCARYDTRYSGKLKLALYDCCRVSDISEKNSFEAFSHSSRRGLYCCISYARYDTRHSEKLKLALYDCCRVSEGSEENSSSHGSRRGEGFSKQMSFVYVLHYSTGRDSTLDVERDVESCMVGGR